LKVRKTWHNLPQLLIVGVKFSTNVKIGILIIPVLSTGDLQMLGHRLKMTYSYQQMNRLEMPYKTNEIGF